MNFLYVKVYKIIVSLNLGSTVAIKLFYTCLELLQIDINNYKIMLMD